LPLKPISCQGASAAAKRIGRWRWRAEANVAALHSASQSLQDRTVENGKKHNYKKPTDLLRGNRTSENFGIQLWEKRLKETLLRFKCFFCFGAWRAGK
jgi:hypothetical protein